MSKEYLNLFMAFFYVAAVVFMAVFFSWLAIQRRKNSEAMKKNVLSKLSSDIDLASKDISHIGKAFGLTAYQARQVVYKIYSDTSTKDEFEKLKSLVTEIEKEEPFDDLPDEVKPSMIRLTKITSESGEESDNHLLSPISQTLNKYVDLTNEKEKLKKQTTRAYIITVISFIFGVISTYFTITSPSATEIAEEINKQQLAHAETEHNKQIQSTQKPRG